MRRDLETKVFIPTTEDKRLVSLEEHYAYQAALKRQQAKARYEAHPDVQKWRGMTKEQKARFAIDLMTQKRLEFNNIHASRDTTEDKARAYSRNLARMHDRMSKK